MGTGGVRYGAGRPGLLGKAEHCLRIDVRRWQRSGALGAGATGAWRWTNQETGEQTGSISYSTYGGSVRLSYSINDCPRAQTVMLAYTACHYGGARPWFICPVRGERVGVLYLRAGRFACRHCQRLAYASQSEDVIGRLWRRQSKAEARLQEDWQRPKGMRHATYERVISTIVACEQGRDCALEGMLANMIRRHPALRSDLGL